VKLSTLICKLRVCAAQAPPTHRFCMAVRRATPGKPPPPDVLPALSLICLSGAVAMEPVVELARSVVLASGTLGPAAQAACELGLDGSAAAAGGAASSPPYMSVSTEHHATIAQQLLAIVISGGPQLLRVTTWRCSQPEQRVYERLGEALLGCLPHVPGGSLCFFPSKAFMENTLHCWAAKGMLHALRALLPCADALVIDASESTDASSDALKQYRQHCAAAVAGGPAACLMGVMRGRASEGTDFKDGEARCVFVVGIPLPPHGGAAVVCKRLFNKGHGPPLPSGDTWYSQEGARPASQAIGRVIRHAGDYGAAVLLDCRYSQQPTDSVFPLLPRYLKTTGMLRKVDDGPEAVSLLVPFFAACAARAAAKAAADAAAAAAAAAVKREGVKPES
jgi:Rad3-related DNA helicase